MIVLKNKIKRKYPTSQSGSGIFSTDVLFPNDFSLGQGYNKLAKIPRLV